MNKDRLTKERRSWNMSRIRGKDTMPEKIVRSLLHKMGFRSRLHVRIPIPSVFLSPLISLVQRMGEGSRARATKIRCRRSGRLKTKNLKFKTPKPKFVSVDILLPKYKTAIFVHGCFWHRHKDCKNCTTPTHRQEFWLAKLKGNAARDKLHERALKKLGWQTIVIWECEMEKDEIFRAIAERLRKILPTAVAK